MMKFRTPTHSLWSTSSFCAEADTTPLELASLGAHFNLCQKAQGRLFVLQSRLESVGTFLTARVITTVVLIILTAGVFSMAL